MLKSLAVMICSLALIIVLFFLLFTLIVGLYYSRKTTTLKEYAIGHKNFTTATLVATVLATAYGGGGLIRTVQQVPVQGLYWIVWTVLATLGMWAVSLLAPRMTAFMENLSIAETIGQVYGKLPRVVTALASICELITGLAIQVNVITQAISMFVSDVNPVIIAIVSALILIFYSTLGGIRAVTITDVLQCITFVLIIPGLAWLVFYKLNRSFLEVITVLSFYEKFQFRNVFQWNNHFIKGLLTGSALVISYMVKPCLFQRLYMASSVMQAKKVFLISSIFRLCIISVILLIGVFVFVADPHLPSTAIWPAITRDLAPVFKGLLAIGLLAMAMSTADSALNACSVMVIHDIIGTLSNKKVSSKAQLMLVRITSFVVGMLAMWLTFYQKDLLALLMLGNAFALPIVGAPLLFAIYGFRTSCRTALIGMATGVITILLWKKYLSELEGSVPAMLANGIAMLLAHYSFPRQSHEGWQQPDLEYQQLKQARQRQYYRYKKQVTSFFIGIVSYKRPLTITHVVFVALYILITSWLPLFNRNFINPVHSHLFYWPLAQGLVALAMLIYTITYKTAPTISGIWVMGLIFCLPMDAIWHMAYSQEQCIALVLSFCHFGMLCLLLPIHLIWFSLAMMMGYVMMCRGFQFVWMLMAYGEVFALGTFCIASLIYMKYKYIKKTQQTEFFSNQQQAMQEQILQRANKIKYLDMLTTEAYSEADILAKISKEQAHFFSSLKPEELKQKDVQDAMDKFIKFSVFFGERSKLAQGYLKLKFTKVSLYDLINHIETNLLNTLNYQPRLYIEPSIDLLTLLTCDINLMSQALEDILVDLLDVHYAGRSIQQQVIAIAFYTTQLQYNSSRIRSKNSTYVQESYPGIAIRLYNATTYPYSLPPIQSSYDETIAEQTIKVAHFEKNPKQVDAAELSKHQIKAIIAAHYGYYIERFTLEPEGLQALSHQSHTSCMPKLVLLPQDGSTLRQDIIEYFPKVKRSAKEAQIMGDAIMELLEFQHFMVHVVKLNHAVLSSILYLLQKAYDVRQHDCGELLLKRAIGIAREVATFTPDHNAIYAALLYDVPNYTGLPMSYIRAHYAEPIASYLSELVAMSDVSSKQKYKIAMGQNQTPLICIKLTERWYDLVYAKGYKDKHQVIKLAKETLEVDVPVAKQFFSDILGKNLAKQLESAALQALSVYKWIN